MKIGILAAGKICFPSLQLMLQTGVQLNLVLPKKHNEELEELKQFANYCGIPWLEWNKRELVGNLISWSALNQLDALFVMTFPYIFPKELIKQIQIPFLNFHFTPLPEYAGAHPIFWLIKNGIKKGGISVHQLTEGVDTGAIFHYEPYIVKDYETFGSYKTAVSELNAKVSLAVVQKLGQANWQNQLKQQNVKLLNYRIKPELKDVQINWQEMKAVEIERLCRACNPWNRGALTTIGGALLKLVELKIIDDLKHMGEPAGQIELHKNTNRLIISTVDQSYLDIQIAYLNESFFSNIQLQKIGLTRGLCLSS